MSGWGGEGSGCSAWKGGKLVGVMLGGGGGLLGVIGVMFGGGGVLVRVVGVGLGGGGEVVGVVGLMFSSSKSASSYNIFK